MSAIAIPEALRVRFVERLAERVTTLEATLRAFDGCEPRLSLERQFHSLAGIAGTYGYHAITELARSGELRSAEGADRAELFEIVRAIAEHAAAARAAAA